MNISTQNLGNISRYHLTNLPTTLWSLSASFLSLKDLGSFSVTHRVFIEALTKLTDEQKEFLEQCRNYPKFPHKFSFMENERSYDFSLPILFQLRSLKTLNDDMLVKYEKTVRTPQYYGETILSKCVSLKSFCLSNKTERLLIGLKTCQSLIEIELRNVKGFERHLDSLLRSNGFNLEKITLDCFAEPYHNILDAIILNCPNLKALTMTSQFMHMPPDFASLPNLNALTVNGLCLNLNLEDLIPLISSRPMTIINLLSTVPMTQKYIDALEHNSSRLEHLCLAQQYVTQKNTLSFSRLLSRLENIRFLNLCSCDIDDTDLEILIKHAPKLNYLFISNNSKITFEPIRKMIENLPIKQISVIDCENVNEQDLIALKETKGIY